MGTGYVRADTPNNIADGNIVNADDLDGEFDALQATFDASTGHTHDGTTAEGGPITVIGPAQEYVATNAQLQPKANNTYDLGSVTNQWKDLYVDGVAYLDSVDIDAGSIDGATIGGVTPAAGTFTTLNSTSGTITTLGATTGNITTVNATTVDTTNLEVTSIKAKDGTASATIADTTGVMTIASAVLTTADINGGTADGVVIGGATPAAITGTTITAGTGFTGNLTGNVTGTVSSIANHDTDDLAEGATNLYYTTARFDTAFSGKTTTDLTEGTNLYYTTARFDTAFAGKTTTNLAEGTNLYYTAARFDTAFSGKTTTDLAEGTNLYYTTARANTDFDTRLATKSTTDLTEGTNLYYTDARANAAIDARVDQTFVNNLNVDAATLGGDSKTTILAQAQADALALAIALG